MVVAVAGALVAIAAARTAMSYSRMRMHGHTRGFVGGGSEYGSGPDMSIHRTGYAVQTRQQEAPNVGLRFLLIFLVANAMFAGMLLCGICLYAFMIWWGGIGW